MEINSNSRCFYASVCGLITSILLTPVVQAQTRVLEEITVTAQRREQSLQEVPISLEAYSGADLVTQGFRSMEDLSSFSPSVEIEIRTQDQDVSIRGMGTVGNNLGLEQAAPTFSDGVHMGRTSMITAAFMDLERIEILRGPQPIAFGQNATAGAFSVISRKPTPTWEGNINAEVGNFGRKSVEAGLGGPITDTLGIRVAGKVDRMTGYIRDVVSRSMFPFNDLDAARITLAWNPTDNIETSYKLEYASTLSGGDSFTGCRTQGLPEGTDRLHTFIPGQTALDDVLTLLPLPDNCDTKGFQRIGIYQGSVKVKPVFPMTFYSSGRSGTLDINDITVDILGSNKSSVDTVSYSHRLGLVYNFDNGSYIEATTGYVDYRRITMDDNSRSPVQGPILRRGELFDMWSQDLRYVSARGEMFEWEAGLYYQVENLGLGNRGNEKYGTINLYPDVQRAARAYANGQDTEWYSAFGSFTFNFLDDKASIDVGGRFTKIAKDSLSQSFGANWIFDVNPDPNNTGNVPSTEYDISSGLAGITVVRVRNVRSNLIDCATGRLECGSFGAGYWTTEWRGRDIPDVWNLLAPVALGPYLDDSQMPRNEGGPYTREYRDTNFDPQVVLRYRPTDNHSVYGKWARAFKGGGMDINTGTVRGNDINPEYAEAFEVGAKGTLMDRTFAYDVAVFNQVINDLQMAARFPSVLQSGTSFSTNAGKQRNRGIEFNTTWAATDRLTLGLAGVVQDGVMVDFAGAGCNDAEFAIAETGPCLTAAESIALVGNTSLQGRIDRSGSKAPRTPDWKFMLDLDYWHPVANNYKVGFATKTTFSDGYVFLLEDFERKMMYPSRVISNLNLSFADINDTWEWSFWVRNLFDKGYKYYPENDLAPSGVEFWDNPLRNFRSYGVQFNYNYN